MILSLAFSIKVTSKIATRNIIGFSFTPEKTWTDPSYTLSNASNALEGSPQRNWRLEF